MHALIIEDEPLIALSIEDVLREWGFDSFDLATSPKEAFEAVSRTCPDLITSDVQLMPGSGIDTVQTICSRRPIPVIFITGNVADVSERMPDTIALAKPFSKTNLMQAVDLVLTEPNAVSVLVLADKKDCLSAPNVLSRTFASDRAGSMQIVKLPAGVSAAMNVDCISITRLSDGGYDLTGSALTTGETGQDDSVSIEGAPYETYEEAESAGLAWAAGLRVTLLYLETVGSEGLQEQQISPNTSGRS